MGVQYNSSGKPSGFQYEKSDSFAYEEKVVQRDLTESGNRDEDLVIEENTIYEIDRNCYERLKRQKKRKM